MRSRRVSKMRASPGAEFSGRLRRHGHHTGTPLIFFALLTLALASPPPPCIPRRPTIRYFIATAYSVEGTGASGKWSHPGTVAADRTVLPLNSRIRIYGAGRYSRDYTVEDTGGKVDGHHIDIYMPSQAEAKKFGRQRVMVVILKYGDDEVSPPDPQQKAEAKAADRRVRATANRDVRPRDGCSTRQNEVQPRNAQKSCAPR
jgi:3D (Asp-Asp-Asp) domain-containing protein